MAPQREWFDKDYYSVLGVPQGATEKEITSAYRKLAKQYHPDANPGNHDAEEKFKEVSAANDVLGDAAKRKEYDEVRRMVASGAYSAGPGGGFGPGGGPGGFSFDEGVDLGDLFGGLFGGGGAPGGGRGGFGRSGRGRGARHAPQRGSDLETELHLDFMDAIHGVTTSVSFTAEATCSVCHGSGAEPGTHPQTCPQCSGSGQIAVDQGPFSFSQVCPTCGGRGAIIETPCHQCRGSGVEVRPREVKVKIPIGVDDGQRIRVKGRGGAGANGGPPGDLYVVVHVRPHRVFGRRGRHDLTVRVPLTFTEATLGAAVKVPTLTEPVTLKVKAGTAGGTTQKVKGRGIVPAKGSAGDLYVTFDIDVPTKVSREQKKVLEELAEAFPGNSREHLEV
ncbi:MAG: molecular chaperone DnaJ [Acidimicrobiia bacterium]